MQSEHAGVVQARADQVVVSERRAIIAIRIRVHIRGGKATGGIQGSIRPLRRHFTDETNQRGLRDRLGEVAFIGPRCGNPLEYLLVIDLTGTLSTHPLHGEVEYVRLICRNIVEVDAGPQKFAGTRPKCLQLQRLRSGFQGERRGARAVHHPHDEGLAPAVVEELLDGIAQEAWLPEAAEHVLEFHEAFDEYRPVDRSAQCAADEGGARRGQTRDGLIGAAFFGDL